MKRLFWIAIPLLLAAAPVQAEWTWPWENSDSLDRSENAAGFLGDLFGGKRTHLELDVELDMGMRYDMEHSRSGYSRYLGYQFDDANDSYSQPYAMPRWQGRSTQAETSQQQTTHATDSYRAAFAAQRRVVEEMRTTRKDPVPHLEAAATTAASEADPERMFRQLEAERDAAFREMEERRLRHAGQFQGLSITSNGLTLQQE